MGRVFAYCRVSTNDQNPENQKLEILKWWDWPIEKIHQKLPYILNGDISNLFDNRK